MAFYGFDHRTALALAGAAVLVLVGLSALLDTTSPLAQPGGPP